jgi:L-threonate 2-dehydrogenase
VIAFLSGDDAAKARALGVVEAMTRKVYDAGGFGNGSRLKFVANLLARRAGLDLDLVLRAVGDGAGGSRMLQVRGPLMVAGDYSDPSVRVEVFSKDIDIIAEFARELRSPTPLFALTSVFYQAALAQGRAGQDSACVMAVLEQLAGGGDGGAGRDGD